MISVVELAVRAPGNWTGLDLYVGLLAIHASFFCGG